MRCPDADGSDDYTAENPCTFKRKLCVRCSTKPSGTVMINIKTNGLPSHCFNSTVNNAKAINTEFSVAWQPSVSADAPNYTAEDLDSSAKTDEIMCDIQRTAFTNMMDVSEYSYVRDPNN